MEESFLQSSEWEEFQKIIGTNPFRINGKLVEILPLILGQKYLYCPRAYFASELEFRDFIEKAINIAKEKGAFFIRMEPVFKEKINIDKFQMHKVSERQPSQTLIMDLSKDLELLINQTKSKTRYNIKLAQKKGVIVKSSNDQFDLDNFIKLSDETAARDKIRFRDSLYYENLLSVLKKYKMIKIYSASFNNVVIASAIKINYQDTSIYLYGASSNEYRNVMAPYLLQWQMIVDAKSEGYKRYDFWGVAPLILKDNKFEIKDPDHSWSGITKFKLGFVPSNENGIYETYPGCFELSIGKKRYFLYKILGR